MIYLNINKPLSFFYAEHQLYYCHRARTPHTFPLNAPPAVTVTGASKHGIFVAQCTDKYPLPTKIATD